MQSTPLSLFSSAVRSSPSTVSSMTGLPKSSRRGGPLRRFRAEGTVVWLEIASSLTLLAMTEGAPLLTMREGAPLLAMTPKS
jgi:hypothetical protein